MLLKRILAHGVLETRHKSLIFMTTTICACYKMNTGTLLTDYGVVSLPVMIKRSSVDKSFPMVARFYF